MTRKWLLALCLMVLWTFPQAALAETRIALVIGNADYRGSLPPLGNPVNDAELMADALRSVGFEIIASHDASQKEMKRAIAKFGAAIKAGGQDVTGLFYYAGHGLQVGGVNYLVPVNANIAQEGDVDLESVAADSVLRQMEYAGAKTSIVILDACRNNPLPRGLRSADRGLARMDTPNGSFLAYSTAPGDVAQDGKGKNSPFAKALATEITKPDQAIEVTFRNVRIRVMTETEQQQVPWDSSSMITPFYFAAPGNKTVASAAPVPALESAPLAPAPALAAPAPAPVNPVPQPAAITAPEPDFVSPLPDGTIVLSRRVKADLDAYLAKVATLEPVLGSIKFAFFYVSEDGRHSGSYTCRANLLETGDCPRSDMTSGSTAQSRQRARRACEDTAPTDCVYLYRADEKKAEYKTLD